MTPDMKTVQLPIANNPGYDALQITMLDSSNVSTHNVGPSLSTHACHPSTDLVEIHVSGDTGIYIGNGNVTSEAQMLDLPPGIHFYGLPDGLKTLVWKAIGDDTVVKVLEVR
jgi:hypothetical protein